MAWRHTGVDVGFNFRIFELLDDPTRNYRIDGKYLQHAQLLAPVHRRLRLGAGTLAQSPEGAAKIAALVIAYCATSSMLYRRDNPPKKAQPVWWAAWWAKKDENKKALVSKGFFV